MTSKKKVESIKIPGTGMKILNPKDVLKSIGKSEEMMTPDPKYIAYGYDAGDLLWYAGLGQTIKETVDAITDQGSGSLDYDKLTVIEL